jgi:hypothetical protein
VGNGTASTISGPSTTYAGGGGGGGYSIGQPAGLGGTGGGADGTQPGTIPTAATANTGGGGGGAGQTAGSPVVAGGTGGSGIVILKYLAKPNMQIFQADGSWTCPTGITEVEYLVVAGGGGGGNIGWSRWCWWVSDWYGLSVSAGTTYLLL